MTNNHHPPSKQEGSTNASTGGAKKRVLGCSSLERSTLTLRLLFVGSMLVAAAVFGGLAYKITKDQEENTAIQTYQSIALSAVEEAQAIALRKIQGAESLATFWSFAFPEASQWPFVGFKGFSQLATNVALLSATSGHGFMTIVRPDQVEEFEAHAKQLYQDYQYPETAGQSEFGFGIYGMDPSRGYSDGRFHDIYGNTTWGNKYDIMVPFLQHKNTFPDPSLLLMNLHQFELRGRLMESIIDCGKVADPNTTVSPKCGAVTNFTEIFVRPGPSAVFFNPIFPMENPREVVGFIGTSINWEEVLTDIVPDIVDGLDCIISNGVESYSYVIHNGMPILRGEGDLHDPEYDGLGHSTTLSDTNTGAKASVTYTLTVYPTQVMFEEFQTNIPMIAAIGFAAVIFLCTCLFFSYDYLMKYATRQQKEILEMKRRFVRFISHEIRTPMNVVCMGLDLLQTELQDKLEKEKLHQKPLLLSPKENGTVSAEQDTKNTEPEDNKEEGGETSYWLGLIQEILENSHNAVSVLNDLLNYDKVESGTFELYVGKVDILSSARQTVREFAIQARNRNIDLVLRMEDPNDMEEGPLSELEGIFVIGDERRLSQCIRNLISNALKFTPENSTVTVTLSYSAEGLSDAEPPTHKGADASRRPSERAGSIIIQVTDHGVGLSSDQLNLLFSEGVQFNPDVLQHGGGSGLGLCLTKEIVEMHSGRIEARSDGLGLGTTFEMELPLYKGSTKEADEVNPAQTEASSMTSHDDHRHLVLVVDDVRTNSKMLVRVLERAGHTCLVASNGKEAVEAFEANRAAVQSGESTTPIHTILMDFEMPEMNGPDASRRLREMGCTARIFGVTGNVLSEDVAVFKASGADCVLYKPINLPAIDTAWENMDRCMRS